MQVNILCAGDVVGSPGRRVLQTALAALVPARHVDLVVVNAENAAAGSGLTPQLLDKILGYGVDLVTLGDHLYRRREIIPVLETSDRVVRPANLPATAPGKTVVIRTTASGQRVAVISLLGRMYMKIPANCPFAAVDHVLAGLPRDVKIVVVDMHAETTSEKVAMGWHLDGRVSLVFGTHTHVPTADERILPHGTAYITDLGMTGPYDSVLGRLKDRVVGTMISGVPSAFDVAEGDARMCGVLVSVDSTSGRATHIERLMFHETGRTGNG